MKKFYKFSVGLLCLLLIQGCASFSTSTVAEPQPHHDSLRKVAMKAYVEGDYHLAEGLLQQLAEPPHLDPQAPCFLGALHYRQHAYSAALKRFKECRTNYPERSEAWFNAAASHLRLATELLLTGKSFRQTPNQTSHDNYENLLEALLRLQRVEMNEVR